MTDARALMPVVLGVGLATLTAYDTSAGDMKRQRPWHEPLFILATQLVGFAIVGAALFVAAWSAERDHPMGPADLKAENLFIVALGGLIFIVAVRRAWTGVVSASDTRPWERGLLDKISMLLMMLLAIALITFLGMILDDLLIGTSRLRIASAIPLVLMLIVGALNGAFFLLRYVVGGGSLSPRAFAMSRRQQARMLSVLCHTRGTWLSLCLRPVGELEPDWHFCTSVWQTDHGWYFRTEDAYALARYHSWAAEHLRIPTAAFHLRKVSIFAGPRPLSWRGVRITPTTRRWWWLDAWRSHRESPGHERDDCVERRAGLVHISHHDLNEAGLIVVIGSQANGAPEDS